MAVQQITFSRGGKDYIAHKGIDDAGEFVEYIEEVARYKNNLEGRFFPAEKRILHKQGKGNVSFILTTFNWALFDEDGEMVEGTLNDKHPDFGTMQIKTNASDQHDFTAMFGNPVSIFDINGFVRKIMGFNNYKLFDSANGTVLTWTTDQLAEPPTNDYND